MGILAGLAWAELFDGAAICWVHEFNVLW